VASRRERAAAQVIEDALGTITPIDPVLD